MLNFETEGRDTVIKLHLRIVAKKIKIKKNNSKCTKSLVFLAD